MNKPLNLNKQSCSPLSSNCIIWQGPDIACLNLCKGDSITEVVHDLAVKFCSLLEQLEVDSFDLNCLVSSGCPPDTFHDIIQLLIDVACKGVKGDYVKVEEVEPGEDCATGGISVTMYSGIDNSIVSTDYVCNGECVCETLITSRMWSGDFSMFSTGVWMRSNPSNPDFSYSGALLHTINTGSGLYEVELETAISIELENTANWQLGLRINGATPVTPAFISGAGLDNFRYAEIRTASPSFPFKNTLLIELQNGDTLIPDLRVTSIAGESGTPQFDYIKMIIKKL